MSSVRHDWYQTEQKVVINVLIKNAAEKNCSVDIQSDSVSVKGDDNINLEFKLFHKINATESSYKVSSVKIEITLRKITDDRWISLTKSADDANVSQPKSISSLETTSQPKAASESVVGGKEKNWDQLVKDMWDKEDIEKVNISIYTYWYVKTSEIVCH